MMTNNCRRLCFIFRAATFFVCVAISGNLFATTSNQYCDNDMAQHHIDFSIEKLQGAALDTGAEVELTRRELNAGMIVSNQQDHSMAIDFNFQYTIVSIDDSISPMTNGHLHSWDFPVIWQRKATASSLNSLEYCLYVRFCPILTPLIVDKYHLLLKCPVLLDHYRLFLNGKHEYSCFFPFLALLAFFAFTGNN